MNLGHMVMILVSNMHIIEGIKLPFMAAGNGFTSEVEYGMENHGRYLSQARGLEGACSTTPTVPWLQG